MSATSVVGCARRAAAQLRWRRSCCDMVLAGSWIFSIYRGLVPGASESRRMLGPSGPEHLRLAFEELGPTFIKLGQVLSTRPDLVPPEYESALAVLQDAAPAVPTVDIVRAVEAALGQPIGQTFSDFRGGADRCRVDWSGPRGDAARWHRGCGEGAPPWGGRTSRCRPRVARPVRQRGRAAFVHRAPLRPRRARTGVRHDLTGGTRLPEGGPQRGPRRGELHR